MSGPPPAFAPGEGNQLVSWRRFGDFQPAGQGDIPEPSAFALLVKMLRWPTLALVVLISLSLLYRYGPCRRSAKWRWVFVGATLATVLGSSFYTALIDNNSVATLYDDPSSVTAGAFLSNNLPALAFGVPIPSQPGPAVNTSIGIRLDFTLTPGDSASFTSNFVVVVPEPNTALLMGLGLALMALRRRKA